jgi:hypothetical protein
VRSDQEAATPVSSLNSSGVSSWPLYAVLGLSAVGVLVALILRSYLPSLGTYGVLLVIGCGLLFYHRRVAIDATRRAGGSGYLAILGLERLTIGILALSCLANGLVIAFETASWDWGF